MFNFDAVSKGRCAFAALLMSAPAIYLSLKNGDNLFSLVKSIIGFLIIVVIISGVIAAALFILYFLVMLLAWLLLGKNAIESSEDSILGFSVIGTISLALGYIFVCLYFFGVRIHF